MKKRALVAIIGLTSTCSIFAQQHQQSMSFTGPTDWIPGTSVTLSVFLTINYDAFGVSYWLEVPNGIAPFLFLRDPMVGSVPFDSTVGASPGYLAESHGLGFSGIIPPGTTHIGDVTLMVNPSAPLGTYTLYTTSHTPRISEVTDTDFNDNNIIPPGQFVFNIVPEPSTFVLLWFGAIGSAALIFRHQQRKGFH